MILKVTEAMTKDSPGELVIPNSRFVKLGLDTDRWEKPVLIGTGILVLTVAACAAAYRRKRKR